MAGARAAEYRRPSLRGELRPVSSLGRSRHIAEDAVARVRSWVEPMGQKMARARTLGLAAEMSFWMFLSLVPLAAVVGLVAARVATRAESLEGAVLSSVPPEARDLIREQVERVAAWHGARVAPVALGIFVWLAATGIHSVFDVLEVQAEATRPWWKKRLLAIATCIALSVGLAILGLLAVGVRWIERAAGRAIPHVGPAEIAGSWAETALRVTAGGIVAVSMVAALYAVGIPRAARTRAPILPGALAAVFLIGCLGWGYRLYLSTTGGEDAYQGGLAVVGVTLMTLWLFSVALLLGADLNLVLGKRRRARSGPRLSLARRLPYNQARWPISVTSWFRPTSPRPPTEPSTGPFRSPKGSAPGSR